MVGRWCVGVVMSLVCGAALVSLTTDAPARADGPATATATAPAGGAPEGTKIYLMDGSILAGKIGAQYIEVQTKYGTLKVPLSEVRSFTPGLASHTEFNERLAQLITDLGADGFAERERATEVLRKMGAEIRPELEKALKTAETEKAARLMKLIEEIDQARASMGAEEEAVETWSRADTVVTPDFTIAGQILTRSFEVSSAYGTLTVKLGDIKSVRRDGGVPEDVRRVVTVAGALVAQRTFENSGVRVNKGDVIQITASGSIVMSPWGSNSISGPDGGNNYGMMQPGNFPGGCLIGRLGQNGPVVKIGSKTTITADRAGVIMFGIAMQSDYSGNQFPGEYTVKVRVIKKAQ